MGEQPQRRFAAARTEQNASISVANTGVGMEANVRSRIFEFYFTTKKPGEGGWSRPFDSHSIVRERAGFIGVTSEPGWGSMATIYLPIPQDEAATI